jgi:hypothetical protein
MATATMNKTRPIGNKPMHELKNNKAVTALCTDISRKGYTIEESYNRGLDRLSELYGTDFRKL